MRPFEEGHRDAVRSANDSLNEVMSAIKDARPLIQGIVSGKPIRGAEGAAEAWIERYGRVPGRD